jgi:hypothetical protein
MESSDIGNCFNSFEWLLKDFKLGKFKYLRLIDYDDKLMTLTMFVDYEGFHKIKRIWQMDLGFLEDHITIFLFSQLIYLVL